MIPTNVSANSTLLFESSRESIAVKVIPKAAHQSTPERSTRRSTHMLVKDIQSKRIGVSANLLHLNREAR
jgi:hypothetical protein